MTTAVYSTTGQKPRNKQFAFYLQGSCISANLSDFSSAFIKLDFQGIRNPEKLNFGWKPGTVVTVVQEPNSKCLEAWWAEKPLNTLQFILVTLIIHLVTCRQSGQEKESLQSAD